MLLEHYEIGELLADSGRNTVRRVRRLSDGVRLVVKMPSREYPSVRELRRLEFEYHVLCKLKSPGVIRAVDIERQSGRLALVLEDFGSVIYQFPHDRVVEAAYSLLGDAERALYHLRTGRMLRDAIPEAERAHRVFDFIDHLNRGSRLIEDGDERNELTQLNYAAAQKARRSAAYATAIAYLTTSESLLSADEWATRRAHQFECARMRVECTFLSGSVENAYRECAALLASAPSQVSRVAAFCLKAAILEQQSRLGEAVETIRQGLAELGVVLPEDPNAIGAKIGAGIGKLQAHLERTAIEDLVKLPAVSDPLRAAAMELLFQLIPAASQINPPLFILAELILFDMALTHGTVPASAKNFMDCGIVLGAMLNDYARAYRMVRVVLRNGLRGATLRFWGDGRGLDLAGLRRAAGGVEESDEQTAARIFGAGVSTAKQVTHVSGRGVGLDAVRALFRERGGDVTVALTGPVEAGHRPFELIFELPPDASLSDAQRPSRAPSTPPARTRYSDQASAK